VPEASGHTASDALTEQVVASFDSSPTARYREVMQALVHHLHDFAREVDLSEPEWFAAIDFLTRAGQISDAKRQEFVLLSDVLGLSMLTVGLSQGSSTQATEPTVFGPFFVEGAPEVALGGDLAQGASGEPCLVRGRVVGADGAPLAGARVDVWQADDQGFYDVQYASLEQPQGRGHLHTDDDGGFTFWTVRPVAYPIPDDGPAGELLTAAGRGPMRPAHIHFMISAPGHRTLITHVFDREDEYLGNDAVFGVKESLVAEFARHEPGRAPDGRELPAPWYTLDYEFVLAPAPGSTA
jgi:hydroxyquinol 1,2-dioxygenase